MDILIFILGNAFVCATNESINRSDFSMWTALFVVSALSIGLFIERMIVVRKLQASHAELARQRTEVQRLRHELQAFERALQRERAGRPWPPSTESNAALDVRHRHDRRDAATATDRPATEEEASTVVAWWVLSDHSPTSSSSPLSLTPSPLPPPPSSLISDHSASSHGVFAGVSTSDPHSSDSGGQSGNSEE